MKYDLFISHANEDKQSFVRPLAEALESKGLKIWYDEFTLKIGDNILSSIDKGLASSRYGIVVISPDFLLKNWTRKELGGLIARETIGELKILPIWHDITYKDVVQFSPTLADIKALSSDKGIRFIVRQIFNKIEFESSESWLSNEEDKSILKDDFSNDYDKYDLNIKGTKHILSALVDNSDTKEKFDLANKVSGKRFLEHALIYEIKYSNKNKISVLMMDIDDLSKINKVYGVQVGDAILVKAFELIKNRCSKFTNHYGRCGDDTFFIIVYGSGKVKAKFIAESLVKDMEEYSWDNIVSNLRVTWSFGVARLATNESIKESILRAAIGMNNAKKEGRNIVVEAPVYIGESASREYHDYWS